MAKIDVKMHVTQMKRNSDVILGRDFLSKLGIVLDFEQQLVRWGNKIFKMRLTKCSQETSYFVSNTPDIATEKDHMLKMLDAKYKPEDLDEVAATNKNVTLAQRKNYINC